jgi:hypothetical protein
MIATEIMMTVTAAMAVFLRMIAPEGSADIIANIY